jgi:hypothetical protein
MRLSTLLSKHLTDAANQTASIILIYVQLFGRYEFSKGPLQFGILVKKHNFSVFIILGHPV